VKIQLQTFRDNVLPFVHLESKMDWITFVEIVLKINVKNLIVQIGNLLK